MTYNFRYPKLFLLKIVLFESQRSHIQKYVKIIVVIRRKLKFGSLDFQILCTSFKVMFGTSSHCKIESIMSDLLSDLKTL